MFIHEALRISDLLEHQVCLETLSGGGESCIFSLLLIMKRFSMLKDGCSVKLKSRGLLYRAEHCRSNFQNGPCVLLI